MRAWRRPDKQQTILDQQQRQLLLRRYFERNSDIEHGHQFCSLQVRVCAGFLGIDTLQPPGLPWLLIFIHFIFQQQIQFLKP